MAKYPLMLCFAALTSAAGCASEPPQASGAAMLTFLQAPVQAQGLIGSTPAVLDAEFGEPALLRVDGPAQVWLYHSAVCGLNLILYPDASGTPRVATAVPDNNDPARCMASLQRGATTANLAGPASS